MRSRLLILCPGQGDQHARMFDLARGDARAAALAKFPGKPVADRKTGRLLGRCIGLSDHATHQLRIDVIERGEMLFRRQDVKITA